MNMNFLHAMSSMIFAAIFLVSVIVLGGEYARNIAIASAFLGCASQFAAQDDDAYKIANGFAYMSAMTAVASYIALVMGA